MNRRAVPVSPGSATVRLTYTTSGGWDADIAYLSADGKLIVSDNVTVTAKELCAMHNLQKVLKETKQYHHTVEETVAKMTAAYKEATKCDKS